MSDYSNYHPYHATPTSSGYALFQVAIWNVPLHTTETRIYQFLGPQFSQVVGEVKFEKILSGAVAKRGRIGFYSKDEAVAAIQRLNYSSLDNQFIVLTFHPSHLPEAFKVSVTSLPSDVTQKVLSDLFGKYGTVVHCDIQRNGKAAVYMLTEGEALACVEKLYHFIIHQGYRLKLSYTMSDGHVISGKNGNLIKMPVASPASHVNILKADSTASLSNGYDKVKVTSVLSSEKENGGSPANGAELEGSSGGQVTPSMHGRTPSTSGIHHSSSSSSSASISSNARGGKKLLSINKERSKESDKPKTKSIESGKRSDVKVPASIDDGARTTDSHVSKKQRKYKLDYLIDENNEKLDLERLRWDLLPWPTSSFPSYPKRSAPIAYNFIYCQDLPMKFNNVCWGPVSTKSTDRNHVSHRPVADTSSIAAVASSIPYNQNLYLSQGYGSTHTSGGSSISGKFKVQLYRSSHLQNMLSTLNVAKGVNSSQHVSDLSSVYSSDSFISNMLYAPRDRWMIYSNQRSVVSVYDTDSAINGEGGASATPIYHKKAPSSLSSTMSHNGSDLLACGSSTGEILLWNLRHLNDDPQVIKALDRTPVITNTSFKCDSSLIAASTATNEILFVDIRTQKLSSRLAAVHSGKMTRIAFNPHPAISHLLLTGSADCRVKIWDSRKLSSSNPLPIAIYEHDKQVTSVAWSPLVSNMFASSSLDGTVHICQADDKSILHVHAIHATPVLDVAWNPEPEFAGALASLSAQTLNIWRPNVYLHRK